MAKCCECVKGRRFWAVSLLFSSPPCSHVWNFALSSFQHQSEKSRANVICRLDVGLMARPPLLCLLFVGTNASLYFSDANCSFIIWSTHSWHSWGDSLEDSGAPSAREVSWVFITLLLKGTLTVSRRITFPSSHFLINSKGHTSHCVCLFPKLLFIRLVQF